VLQLLNLVRAAYTNVDANIFAEHEIHNFESSHHSDAGNLEISRDTTMQLSYYVDTLPKLESYQQFR